MNYGNIHGIEKPVSRLVQGTVMLNSQELEKSFALLDEVYALGGTTFDTAHGYGNGDCERTLGQWIRQRDNRDNVVVISKGGHHNQDRKRVTPFDITADLHDSLARLKFESIDLYLLHRDDPVQPVGPIVETLNEHLRAGRIKAFGASNWTWQRIDEANQYAGAHGLAPFIASSPQFSLAEQVKEPWSDCVSISGPDHESARQWYSQKQMALFTWSSLAGGFFSGRFTRDNLDSFSAYMDKICVESYCHEMNFKRLDRAKTLAQEKGLSLPQIALAYVMSQPLNVFALVGCQSGREFAENIEACNVELNENELAWLELKRDVL